jgi:hypothetical protein
MVPASLARGLRFGLSTTGPAQMGGYLAHCGPDLLLFRVTKELSSAIDLLVTHIFASFFIANFLTSPLYVNST